MLNDKLAGRPWMLYGATGHTGRLIAEHAVSRGHRPILAGRSRSKLEPVAAALGLGFAIVSLADAHELRRALRNVSLVLHAAGPFSETSSPMLEACLDVGAHYLDITGELQVFEHTLAHDEKARARGIAVVSGVAFNALPSDCLALYLKQKVSDACSLELAVAADGLPSGGTTKAMLDMLRMGSLRRRDGVLEPVEFSGKRIPFPLGPRYAVCLPWGDLSTAFRTTGIPNIQTYFASQWNTARAVEFAAPFMRRVLSSKRVFDTCCLLADGLLGGAPPGPRPEARWQVWGRVENARGEAREASLETPEGYIFSARAAVQCVEWVWERGLIGAHTPASAFGATAVREIVGVVWNG